MSKELEALKRIQDILVTIVDLRDIKHPECRVTEKWVRSNTGIDIIESALIRLEKIETTTHSVLRDDISKKLKALEIIKESPEFAWYVKVYKNAYEMISDVKGFRTNNSVEELQEMFDLLKEVIKWN